MARLTPRTKWTRRQMLVRGAAASFSACGLLALGVGIRAQPRKRVVTEGDRSLPERLPATTSSRAVVVGGGIAGMVAALELADRGVSVVLLEAGDQLGGKISSYRARVAGDDVIVEHGFHAFFDHYYNLLEVMERAGATAGLVRAEQYVVELVGRAPEIYPSGDGPLLTRMLGVIGRSPSLRMKQFMHDLDPLLQYERDKTYARFDGTSFADFGKAVDPTLWSVLLEPFARQTLNHPKKLSAAEAMRFFQFYFFGNPEGLGHRYAQNDLATDVVAPIERALRDRGVEIRLRTPAASLSLEGGKLAHVELAGGGPSKGTDVSIDTIPSAGFVAGEGTWLGRVDGELVAFDARCTHAGCAVTWQPEAKAFHCPCHGGRYDARGDVIAGPPPSPLRKLPMIVDGERARVTPPSTFERIACDHCVLATDPPATRAILERTGNGLGDELTKDARALESADPYAVWRVWIDRPSRADRPPYVTTSGYPPLDLVALYHRMQPSAAAFAARTGGAVLELHAYALPGELSDEATLRAAMWSALLKLMPEVEGARIVDSTFAFKHDFSRFAPGDAARRPGTRSPIENLFFAGDWVSLPWPAALMEAAAMSGRLAANALLSRLGLRQIPIPTVDPKGPLA